jgi:hypothetical protein
MRGRSSRSALREWERSSSSNSVSLFSLSRCDFGGRDWKLRRALLTYLPFRGRLAQLGERIVRNDEAGGSIPPPSTNISFIYIALRNCTKLDQCPECPTEAPGRSNPSLIFSAHKLCLKLLRVLSSSPEAGNIKVAGPPMLTISGNRPLVAGGAAAIAVRQDRQSQPGTLDLLSHFRLLYGRL